MSDSRALEFKKNSQFQEKTWVVERIGWCVMGLAVLLGLLGAAGKGAFSDTVANAQTFSINYQRFMRYMSPYRIVIQYRQVEPGEIYVTLSRGLQNALSIQQIFPQPVKSRAAADGLHFDFLNAGGMMTFVVKPDAIGSVTGKVTIGTDETKLRSWVYP